jgi:hypothetical protein
MAMLWMGAGRVMWDVCVSCMCTVQHATAHPMPVLALALLIIHMPYLPYVYFVPCIPDSP